MEHQLPQLPFAMDALAPHMSKETFEYQLSLIHIKLCIRDRPA